jgi:hypothetical protein
MVDTRTKNNGMLIVGMEEWEEHNIRFYNMG